VSDVGRSHRARALVRVFIACGASQSACGTHAVQVEVSRDEHVFSSANRRAIQAIADSAARDVRAELPELPKRLTLVVESGKKVIPETGETATAVPPASVYWTVDPDRDVPAIIRAELRPTLFHELHHLVRAAHVATSTLADAAVTEGLELTSRQLRRMFPPVCTPREET
jgi:Predicted Zn-dependent protease (DUF2268)